MDSLLQDLRFAGRMLVKTPAFTLIAVVTLALAIGANTALFSVVNAVLLRPLPFHAPDRLVAVRMTDIGRDNAVSSVVDYPDFLDWRAQTHSFAAMSVWRTSDFTLTGQGEPIDLNGVIGSANLISTLRVSPILGRTFTDAEDRPGASGFVAILSYQTWRDHFGADSNVIGRGVVLGGKSYTVVGVMPPKFQFPIENDPVDLWTTMAPDVVTPSDGGKSMGEQRGAHYLRVIARLNPSVSIAQAQSELAGVQARLDKQYPENRPTGINIVPEKERIVGKVHDTLLVLLGAVCFVLLIACANIANLLLTRATARQREIGIRTALGASRGTILRQLLTESVLLSLIGGAFGLLLAFWSTRLLVGMAAKSLPRVAGVGIDGHVLVFTAAVAIVCGLIFGLFPALQISQLKLSQSLNDTGRNASESAHQGRLRGTLVVSEIALALVLLIGSGLLIQTLFRLQRVDPGFRKDQLITFELYLPDARYPDAKIPPFYRELTSRIRALPGVQAASGAFGLPFAPNNMTIGFDIAGHPVPTSERESADTKIVALDYFRTMGIPLVAGRDFGEQDTSTSTPVMMINQAFAKKYFPNENPVGQHVKPGIGFGKDGSKMREVIGVVGNVSPGDLSAPPDPQVYLASAQGPINDLNVIVRTSLPPESILPELRDQVHALDKDLPLQGVTTMQAYVDESIAQPRLDTLLLGIFAGLAFVLTAVGLYGVISYSVAQRTREMGIRMALGAQRGSILKIVLHQGVRMALIGVGIGLCGSLALTRLIASMLYGVKAIDAVTFLCVSVLLFAIAMLASYIPALRATRIDPVVALRYE